MDSLASTQTRIATAMLGIAMFLLTGAVSAQHPNHPLGTSAERLYQGALDHIDRVDLMTGTLGIGIPIGPFNLTYNSNVWRYELDGVGGQVVTIARPDREMTAGLGWHLDLGAVYGPDHWYNETDQWLYVGPDGGRHIFFDDMHLQELEGDPTTLYTRDGTYLRLRHSNNFWVEIEFPDGTVQRFDSGTGGLGTEFRFEAAWGPFGSYSSPDLSVSYAVNGAHETRTVTDRYGRTHYIHLRNNEPWMNRVVTAVNLESYAGQRAWYTFTYETVQVNVSCKHTDPSSPNRIAIPHLVRVDLPDGTAYSMKEGANRLYHNVCTNGIDDVPGVLTGLILPTGGKLAWTHQEYEFPPGETNSPFNTSAGIETRSMIDANGTTLGTWRYRTTQQGFVAGNDPEVRTDVTFPTGDCTRYFFNARYAQNPSEGRGWEYGLPFSTTESVDGRLLSDQVWTSNTGGACSGTKLRSTYVRFRHDRLPGTTNVPASHWHNSNRQLEGLRTVFHDDGNRYVDTEHSEFDGLGHFRRSVTTSNFWSGSPTSESRTVQTAYDRSPGIYPGTFVPPAANDPWLLDTYTSIEISEPDAHGSKTTRKEFVFDPQTGKLRCTRTLAAGTGRSANDIVLEHTRDNLGQVLATKRWGADVGTVLTSGADCGTTIGAPSEDVRYAYQYGVRTKVTPHRPNGQPALFTTLDIDVDPSTGLKTRARDANGGVIDYDYDEHGRLIEANVLGGGRVTYAYQAATGTQGPKTTSTRLPPSGSAVLEQRVTERDSFGRTFKERRLGPSGGWSERRTTRNARGWVTSRSQWGNTNKKAEFLAFDPFGRPGIVRSPTGSAHDTAVVRQGIRKTTVTSRIAMVGGEAPAVRVREVDGHGRLRTVREPSGPNGALVPTTMLYDVSSNVTRVTTGTSPQQVRAYTYDNLGFLRSETHPEIGLDGNGAVTYSSYDTRGQARVRDDGENRLSYTYDDLGRVTAIRDLLQGSRLLTELGYDTAPGAGKGRLAYTIQHNWVDLPWNPAGVQDVAVEERIRYQGILGMASRAETHYRWDNRSFVFEQDLVHDANGDLVSQTLPYCRSTLCLGTPAASSPTLTFAYTKGKLTSVPGWIDAIDYAGSGAWHRIEHANGAVDIRTLDSNLNKRPLRLRSVTADGTVLYDSGTMAYDGAGNPKRIGQDTFIYDAVGRLVDATQYPAGGLGDAWRQQYTYDAFGNQTSRTTTVSGQSPQTTSLAVEPSTNRLANGAYDRAGNLTDLDGQIYRFDAQNRLTGAAWMRYLYNARGERVAAYAAAPNEHMRFLVRDRGDQLTSEITWSPTNGMARYEDHIWAGDRLVGRLRQGGSVAEHYHLDHLGSVRAVSTGGGLFDGILDFLAFGEEVPFTSVEDTFHFAGHERVASSGLDLMHQRAYGSELSRFLSVDAVKGSPSMPQSLNRYSYANNNPLLFVDPDGRDEEVYWGQGEGIPSPSDWNLQVLQGIGQHADAVEVMQDITIATIGFPMMGMYGVPLRMVVGSGVVTATLRGGTTAYLFGPDPGPIVRSTLRGWQSGTILPFLGMGTTGVSLKIAVFLGAVGAEAESVVETIDGHFIAVLSTGDTITFDKDGNAVAAGDAITVTDEDPKGEEADADADAEAEEVERVFETPEERAERSLNALRTGRCIVDPITCAGTGGGGFGGLGRRIQWY